MRTVLFGVDGLTFRVLHPLIERGDLPNFRTLSEKGCEAILESKYPWHREPDQLLIGPAAKGRLFDSATSKGHPRRGQFVLRVR